MTYLTKLKSLYVKHSFYKWNKSQTSTNVMKANFVIFSPAIILTCSVMVGRGRRPWEGDWDSVRETFEPPVSPPTVLVTVLPSGSRSTHLQRGEFKYFYTALKYFPTRPRPGRRRPPPLR